MILLMVAALAGLEAGKTIRLPPGVQDKIVITDRHFDPPVTIDAHGATIKGLKIEASSGIIWRGGTIVAPKGRGDTDPSPAGRGTGPSHYASVVARSADIVFDDVTFADAKIGMVAGRNQRLTVRNSRFRGLRSDGIDSVGNSHVLIENNAFSDTRPIPRIGKKGEAGFIDGDHPDAIQLWAPPDVPLATDIIIRNNRIEGSTQGINTFGPKGDGFQRLVIENNTLLTRYAAGIFISNCADCRVRFNRLEPNSQAQNNIDMRIEASTGQFCGNRITAIPRHSANAACPAD
jgi:hypothetical protein